MLILLILPKNLPTTALKTSFSSIRRLDALVLHVVEVMELLWLALDVCGAQSENRAVFGEHHSFARLVEIRPGPVCTVNDSLAVGVAYLMAFPIDPTSFDTQLRVPHAMEHFAKCQSAR